MVCSFCSGKSYINLPYLKKDFCKKHFERLMQKRFRRNIKNLRMLRKGDKIDYRLSKKPQDVFLGMMLEGMPYQRSKSGKKLSSDFLDMLSDRFLTGVFSGRWPKMKVNGSVLYPLFNFPGREIKAYLRMKNKPFSGDFKTNEFIEQVLKARPGAMFSLSKWWYDRSI
jgi:hypothetical protein